MQVFTVEGSYLGETKTDADGAFRLETGRGNLSANIVVTAPDLGLENLSYVATDEEEIATGETNPDTTLATQSLVADIEDFSGWGFPYSDELAGMDIGCL
ncbi:MAG: hypothetical protein HY324_02860, partial [Chlamydiia bacterium]|nr:hypothetical protein [Chlamydiia bacterium]